MSYKVVRLGLLPINKFKVYRNGTVLRLSQRDKKDWFIDVIVKKSTSDILIISKFEEHNRSMNPVTFTLYPDTKYNIHEVSADF